MNDTRLQAAVERLVFMLDRAAFKAAEQRTDEESAATTVDRLEEDPHKDLFRETISDFSKTVQQLMPILTRLQHTLDPLTRSAARVLKLGQAMLPANTGRNVKRLAIGWRQMQAGKIDRGARGIFGGMRSLLGGATKKIRSSVIRGVVQSGTSQSGTAAVAAAGGQAVAAGGAATAGGGGGAAAAAGALASNPIGWAVAGVAAVAAFTVAVAAAPSAISDFTNSVIESRRKLEHASVEMAMVFAQKDFNKFFRDMSQGDKLAASTEWATKQQEELAKATMQLERIWAKVENYGSGILALLGKLVVDVLPWAVPIVGIAEAINKLVEKGQSGEGNAMLQEIGAAYAREAAKRDGRDFDAEQRARRVKVPEDQGAVNHAGRLGLWLQGGWAIDVFNRLAK